MEETRVTEAVAIFKPNQTIAKTTVKLLVFGQAAVFVTYWVFATPPIIPKPFEVLSALGDMWSGGITESIFVSLMLYGEAVGLAAVISLALAYLTAVPFFRPIASMYGKLRFLGMVGLPFLFTIYLSGVHELKLAMLVFSVSVFLVTGMLDVIDSIPREKYDLARTLRMSEWQVVWEVIVLGRIDVAFDVVRQNAAIGWMMLGTVEALFRSEGGIGTVLANQDKHFHLAGIAAIQILILCVGLLQDYLIGVIKNICCPYASMLLERR